jgi:hypothetical protein
MRRKIRKGEKKRYYETMEENEKIGSELRN